MLANMTEVALHLNAINYDIIYFGFLKRKKKLRIFVKGVLFTEVLMDKKTVIDNEIDKVCNHFLVIHHLLILSIRYLYQKYNLSISVYDNKSFIIYLDSDFSDFSVNTYKSIEECVFNTFLKIKSEESKES